MRILVKVLCTLCMFAVLAGCGLAPHKPVPVVATQPVVLHDTVVRYVPIDAKLTAQVPDPGTAVVPGVTPWAQVLHGDLTCGAALAQANGQLAAIATVQGSNVSTGPPAKPTVPSTSPK